jgi:hypothetical protein
VDGARDIVIESNISHNNQGGIEIGSEERNEKYPVKNITVKNNIVYDNTENGITVGGWNDGSAKGDAVSGIVYDTSVTGNIVLNNGYNAGQLHIAMVGGLTVLGNVFASDKGGVLVASDVDKGCIKKLKFNKNLYYSRGSTSDTVKFELMGTTQSGISELGRLTGENGKYVHFVSDIGLTKSNIKELLQGLKNNQNTKTAIS